MSDIKSYKKKPVVIDAILFTGDNRDLVKEFVGDNWRMEGISYARYFIKTLEGEMEAMPGDYIIKGIVGEFYPCKPEVFTNSYDEVVK